jgi:hypothetical protein
MANRKKSRLFLLYALILLGAFFLPRIFGPQKAGVAAPVAAASGSNPLFLPLVSNSQRIPSATPSPTRTATLPGPTITPSPTSSPTQIVGATPTPGAPQPPIFGAGMTNINSSVGLDQMVAAKISWVRLPGVVWSSVETTEGIYNWSVLAGLETDLKNAASKSIQVVLLVHGTPQWARMYAGTGPYCGPIATAKLAAFGNFMRALVARYSVAPYNVKYWEIWNEQDAPYINLDRGYGCWGDPADPYYGGRYYADVLKAVYPQLKAADAASQVLVGGLVLDCDPRSISGCIAGKYLEGILLNGGAPYFDGVSYHSYDYYDYIDWSGTFGHYGNSSWGSAWNTTGPTLIAKTEFVKSVLSTYGVSGKFLMDTEDAIACGDENGNVPPPYTDYCHTTDFATTKTYFVAETYAAAVSEGVRANLWYDVLGWRNSQLLNSNLSITTAYTAFSFAQSQLRDAAYAGKVVGVDTGGTVGIMGYKFLRAGHRVWVVWSLDGGTHSMSFPTVPLAAWDALGVSVTPANSMNVTLKPLYLESNP